MEHRTLGRSGLRVSVLALGTMTFGAESDSADSHEMLDTFVDAGGTLIDTANVYSRGRSEEIVGAWIARRGGHDDVVLATKGRFPMGDGPFDRGAGRRHLTAALDDSLRRLGADHIDLYQIHGWDPSTPVEETLTTLDGFVRSGKIRYAGFSNVTGWQLQKLLRRAEQLGVTAPISLQSQYSLLAREIEWELLPQCIEEGVGVLPWSPLGGGWLTGKYRRDVRPDGETRLGEDPGRGVEAYDIRNTERTWAVLDAVTRIAEQRTVPAARVALAWVRDRPGVSSVILGARNVGQLSGNLASLDLTLDEEETGILDRVSAPGIPLYPYGFIETYCGVDWWERLVTRSDPPSIGR